MRIRNIQIIAILFLAFSRHVLPDESEVNNLCILLINNSYEDQKKTANEDENLTNSVQEKKKSSFFSSQPNTDRMVDEILGDQSAAQISPDQNHAQGSKGKDILPKLKLPESELLEANSIFPKEFVGKYVYGKVKLTYVGADEEDPYITFATQNMRGFYLDITDPNVARRFLRYKKGDLFYIPKSFPLRIKKKVFTGVYHLELP